MKLSYYTTGDYPIYVNPTANEIKELVERGFDTLRIYIDTERGILAIASGYGNTHDSIIKKVCEIQPRFFPESYILFRQGTELFWNLEDRGGKRKASFNYGLRYIHNYTEHLQLIRDFFEQTIVE